ncbi:PREDICTED: WAT1-related protein At4g08290 isoform X1 [Tarenaya hassleriana]|uniref:WAT1-related protein At4g08290 isoform X2 n=1 Tax=Tarenaya hassleriana TaxID=28532 RepID=UPI00053C4645|nr:PREDICTED: WAT1-related protein At4g08290 isoform X2 [Tarenaya hassleriana]XP_010544717.1 PREDICTED: WAT1-related protein At4g08290 isoform X1 [Tarenaya hassleriana]
MGGLSEIFEKWKPYVLMICLQFGGAGMYIILMATLSRGQNRYVLIFYRNAVAALVLSPFALFFERKVRPKMTFTVFLQIMALGFLEPILDQGFGYLGMKLTSASYTSAIMNALPSITFVIALVLRQEKVNIKEVRSQAKVIGTLVTLGGALAMTLYKGPVVPLPWSDQNLDGHNGNTNDTQDHAHWIAGTMLILLGCVAWSGFYVLQSITIKKYPAELSLSALICFAGAAQSLAVALVMERRSSGWAVGWDARLFAPLYTGIISSGLTYYVQGMVMKTRGPVFVTAFNPLCMVLVAVLASFILHEQIHLGSVIGGVVIAVGLYSVVWGKGKDYTEAGLVIPEKNKNLQELPITAKLGDVDTKLTSAVAAAGNNNNNALPDSEHCNTTKI